MPFAFCLLLLPMLPSFTSIQIIDLDFLGESESIAAFLIKNDNQYALVETGPFSTIKAIEKVLSENNIEAKDISAVFITHIHLDHAGAAWYFAKHGATIYVHPLGVKHLIDPSRLYNSAKQIYGDKMDTLWGEMNPIEPEKIISVAHGEKIAWSNTELTSWHTPGHAQHHIAWQLGNSIFCGDVAGVKIKNGIVVPPCPPPDINVEDWINSINLLKTLKPKKLYLTHFGEISTIQTHLNQLSKRLQNWANYVNKISQVETLHATSLLLEKFIKFIHTEYKRFGANEATIKKYEAANPSFMSLTGLQRYWKKKNTI